MAKFELIMPKMGESIIEATILSWSKNIGDTIEQEETVLEIATDKVDSEVPSPVDGRLMEQRFKEGDVVPVGTVIAIIETQTEENHSSSDNGHPSLTEIPYIPEPEYHRVAETQSLSNAESDRFYSPLVLNIARTEGITMTELEAVSGSGHGGRVTKKDILSYVSNRKTTPVMKPVVTPATLPVSQPVIAKTPTITFSHSGEYEIIEMDRMRKLIAQNMVNSKHVSAHVTSFVEADVTNITLWRNRFKDAFEARYKEKLTYTPVFIQAVARALREHPLVNASVDGEKILIKKDINIGIAVALPSDNLIVPVIRNADRLNLAGLSAAVNDLAYRARINKLKPDELEGGTYTLSNVGTFGNVMGTPIIMQPQVAILATGAIRKIPAVVETPTGDMIAIRQKMFLSHSYDHRIIDGALGGRFVKKVADILEAWDINTPI
ncbi:MAG: dihydrolipoamide acetyltransferase family protein [Bacteroidia bacterium]|nr:dihydrolipoamide acetyltransferase family protein [Bacteroidia bacterium]